METVSTNLVLLARRVELGHRLASARKKALLTQADVARVLGYASRKGVDNLEQGKRSIACERLPEVALAFHVADPLSLLQGLAAVMVAGARAPGLPQRQKPVSTEKEKEPEVLPLASSRETARSIARSMKKLAMHMREGPTAVQISSLTNRQEAAVQKLLDTPVESHTVDIWQKAYRAVERKLHPRHPLAIFLGRGIELVKVLKAHQTQSHAAEPEHGKKKGRARR